MCIAYLVRLYTMRREDVLSCWKSPSLFPHLWNTIGHCLVYCTHIVSDPSSIHGQYQNQAYIKNSVPELSLFHDIRTKSSTFIQYLNPGQHNDQLLSQVKLCHICLYHVKLNLPAMLRVCLHHLAADLTRQYSTDPTQ